MNRTLCSLILASSLLGLVGCERYRHVYLPPQGEQGRQCVARCEADNNTCKAREDGQYRDRQWFYESDRISYQNCMHSMGSTPTGANACTAPSAPSGPSHRICTSVYMNCYERCGGRIEKVRVGE